MARSDRYDDERKERIAKIKKEKLARIKTRRERTKTRKKFKKVAV